jgi:L-threonylcarbamoyladenylate synthase
MRCLPASEAAISEALNILRGGGIIAHATETCYGLACDLTNPHAVERLFAIKQRPRYQPVSALFPSVEEAKKYVEWSARAEELAQEHLPGPLTLILPLKRSLPFILYSTPEGGVTIGVRVSPQPIALSLARSFGRPLSTTSANVHGQPNPYSSEEIIAQFRGTPSTPDLLLDSGTLPMTPPSTIIHLAKEGGESLLREGRIP